MLQPDPDEFISRNHFQIFSFSAVEILHWVQMWKYAADNAVAREKNNL